VLAVYPYSQRIALVVFDGPQSPIDWIIRGCRGTAKTVAAVEATTKLVDRYQPDVIVVRGHDAAYGRRSSHIRQVERLVETYAASQAIDCHRVTREQIRTCFRTTGARTRYEIAQIIAAHIPAFQHHLPPARKPWETERRRLGLFDAASLAMTYYAQGPLPEDERSRDLV
jgi:predicted RNA-binding Zn ribbon-like protein